MIKLKEEISQTLSAITTLDPDTILNLLEDPPEIDFGDVAFPCFSLAKIRKKSPQAIAIEIADLLSGESGHLWSKVAAKGPYLNFYLNAREFTVSVLEEIVANKSSYGKSQMGAGQNVIIDYSSPNIAKPFGVGHIRSTVLGHSLYLIYQFLGYNPIGINHLGDWGTQFGKLIVAFNLWGEEEALEADPIGYLYNLYVRFHQQAEEEPNLEDEARKWFKKLEENDQEAFAYWNRFRKLSLESYHDIYSYLGISFEYYHGESHYNDMLEDVLQLVMEKGIARESEGALIVDLEPYGLPPVMLQKKDGATLYITRDIAAAIYRQEKFNFVKSLYVVGAEQVLHFQQLFKILELLGFEWANKCFHVPFGLIRFKEGRMSTRAGKIILMEEVLQRSVAMAKKIIEEKNPQLPDKDIAAKMVGLGAVRFGDLSNDRIKNIEFDWDKVLDFSGETAVYIQYAHARIASILRKSEQESISWDSNAVKLLLKEEETALVKMLSLFPGVILGAAESFRPSVIARYLIDLAREFNRFYHNCPVLTDDINLKQGRLLLIGATKHVLASGLRLLGIEAPEEM